MKQVAHRIEARRAQLEEWDQLERLEMNKQRRK